MGDFNFDAYTNIYDTNKGGPLENLNLEKYVPEFVDVWPALYPNDKGYTYDSSVNLMLHRPAHDKTRIDRVILKSIPGKTKKQWNPTHIKLIGTQPFMQDSKKEAPVLPSDHFGLVTEIAFV